MKLDLLLLRDAVARFDNALILKIFSTHFPELKTLQHHSWNTDLAGWMTPDKLVLATDLGCFCWRKHFYYDPDLRRRDDHCRIIYPPTFPSLFE